MIAVYVPASHVEQITGRWVIVRCREMSVFDELLLVDGRR
jgi:hypothetical protein